MACAQETAAQELYRCYHCGLASADSSFKYFDNKKADQPRYQCSHCHKFFTLGLHGRQQGKAYAKKRNEDPDELKCLSRQCRHCGVADNALFKYYNNHNISQPRFKCLSCGKQFQMRVLGTGEERRLVHTSSAVQARAPRRKKQGVPESFPNASNGFGSFMPVPSDQPTFLQPATSWFEETVIGEDAQDSNICDAELAKPEENYEANFTSWTGNGDNSVPVPLSGEDAEFGDFLEEELLALLAQEKNEGSNDDALSSTVNVANEFPQTWSNEDAELMNFTGAGEMVPECTSNNGEVMYGTLALENPAATGSEPATGTQNDTSVDPCNVNDVDDVAAFCSQTDFEMPIENSMEQTDTSVDPDHPHHPEYDPLYEAVWSTMQGQSYAVQAMSDYNARKRQLPLT